MTTHQAIAVAVALNALAAAPAAAQAEPTHPIAVDQVYLERPPAVRLLVRRGEAVVADQTLWSQGGQPISTGVALVLAGGGS